MLRTKKLKPDKILLFLALFICIAFVAYSTIKPGKIDVLRPRVNHVFLSVANIDSSVAFYLRAFDMKETNRLSVLRIEQGDSVTERKVKIAFLKFPGQDLAFEVSERAPGPEVNTSGPQLYQHVGVEVNDINVAFQRVKDAGGKVYIPIRIVRTNRIEIKQAFFRGPDGEAIELVEIITGGY